MAAQGKKLLWHVLLLFSYSILVLGKNVAPRAVKKDALQYGPKNFPGNKAPSLKVTRSSKSWTEKDSSQQKSNIAGVPKDHVFYENYQINSSWSDPKLQAALGIPKSLRSRDEHLVKRTPGSKPGDPIFKLPSCVGCMKAAAGTEKVTLQTLSTDYLQRNMKPNLNLQDTCLFYTSVPDPTKTLNPRDFEEWTDRYALGGQEQHGGLSKIATDYACGSNKITIWNMYSGANDVTNAPERPFSRNFWEVYVEGSWLNFLQKNDEQFEYFENMSRAMARVCKGIVYVMSMRPKQMYKYGFIWGTVEYVELHARHSAGLNGAPIKLIAIDAANHNNQYYLDWDTQLVTGQVTKRDPEFLHFDHSITKRDTCDSNVAYEPPNEDWFG